MGAFKLKGIFASSLGMKVREMNALNNSLAVE